MSSATPNGRDDELQQIRLLLQQLQEGELGSAAVALSVLYVGHQVRRVADLAITLNTVIEPLGRQLGHVVGQLQAINDGLRPVASVDDSLSLVAKIAEEVVTDKLAINAHGSYHVKRQQPKRKKAPPPPSPPPIAPPAP